MNTLEFFQEVGSLDVIIPFATSKKEIWKILMVLAGVDSFANRYDADFFHIILLFVI